MTFWWKTGHTELVPMGWKVVGLSHNGRRPDMVMLDEEEREYCARNEDYYRHLMAALRHDHVETA